MTLETSEAAKQIRRVLVEPSDRPDGFGYHVIYSSPEKYEEMVKFYQVFLGGRALAVPDGLTPQQVCDPHNDFVLIVKRDGLPKSEQPLKPGVLHIAWFYNSLAELFYVYRHARDNGIKTVELLNSEVLMQFYYPDPEGNFLEIGVDGHDTSEQTQAVMRGTDGVRTPTGIDHWRYDAEKVLKMLEAGVSDYDIFHHETYHKLAASGRF